jgi:hypothetical protein
VFSKCMFSSMSETKWNIERYATKLDVSYSLMNQAAAHNFECPKCCRTFSDTLQNPLPPDF